MMLKNVIGALVLRVTLGALFLIHGIVKFQVGIENIVGWFESIGLPGFMAYRVVLVEIFGGIALIIGLATRFISALFALLMIGATLKVKLSVGLLGNGKMAGYVLDLAFLAIIALYLVFNGIQILSVSQLFFHKDSNELKRVA